MYVSSVCFKYFICSRHTLQVFYLDVVKLDLDVAYTCLLQAYVFKCFQVFHAYVCKCFISMLHMFAMVFKCFSGIFTSVLSVFFCMLQLLHLDVSKVVGCCTWDTRCKWLAAWMASGAAPAHCWCTRSSSSTR
jgi:hypothetical protein